MYFLAVYCFAVIECDFDGWIKLDSKAIFASRDDLSTGRLSPGTRLANMRLTKAAAPAPAVVRE
jgi:hypothetical protein